MRHCIYGRQYLVKPHPQINGYKGLFSVFIEAISFSDLFELPVARFLRQGLLPPLCRGTPWHALTRFRREAKPERSGVSSIRMIMTVAVIPQDDETVR